MAAAQAARGGNRTQAWLEDGIRSDPELGAPAPEPGRALPPSRRGDCDGRAGTGGGVLQPPLGGRGIASGGRELSGRNVRWRPEQGRR